MILVFQHGDRKINAAWWHETSNCLPLQHNKHTSGTSFSIPSQKNPPSLVSATFVKIVFFCIVSMAFGFVSYDVPGATPKKPYSGLIARNRPSLSNFIQAMSSPTHSAFQPGMVGFIMARFVLPHALGKAAATYFLWP